MPTNGAKNTPRKSGQSINGRRSISLSPSSTLASSASSLPISSIHHHSSSIRLHPLPSSLFTLFLPLMLFLSSALLVPSPVSASHHHHHDHATCSLTEGAIC